MTLKWCILYAPTLLSATVKRPIWGRGDSGAKSGGFHLNQLPG